MVDSDLNSLLTSISELPPLSLRKPKVRKSKRKNNPGFFLFSDWHIGEITLPQRIEGFGEYNYEIARKRLAHITDEMLIWAKRLDLAKAVLLFLGDYISGGIHDELIIGAEFPPPVQAIRAGELVAAVIAKFYENFPVDAYILTTDNHGRLTKPVIYKDKGINNYGYITASLARQLVPERKSLRFYMIETIYHEIIYNGKTILITHGDTIRAWNGIPYYGIDRFIGRECARRNFDYLAIGHFHTPAFIGRTIINGCLTGTNEYTYAAGYSTAPAQVGFTLNPFNLSVFSSAPASRTTCRTPERPSKKKLTGIVL